jgi:putative Holliday junction resolvase
MRILALDHGTVRCGVAVSDPTQTVVTPIRAISPPDPKEVAAVVAEYDAGRVVVGLPVSLSGEEGAQARLTRAFADELGELIEVPVEMYDERLTTSLAEQSARGGASADRDSLAAAHLLESYLASRGSEEERGG